MADNEKRVSTGETQEIPLESLPPIQLPIASDSSSEFDEVSVSLYCVPSVLCPPNTIALDQSS
jgi:hypothetical protein